MGVRRARGPVLARFDALGLVVADMAATVAFYSRLGFDFPAGSDREAHVEVVVDGGLRLMFDTVDLVRSFSSWDPPDGGHRVALAFLCGSPEAVDALHADLVSAGHPSHLAPFDAPWGQRYATVVDPDGNPVDLFAPLG